MEFGWDPEKSNATFASRGFDFAFAARIFAGITVDAVDSRRPYGEVRIRAIGAVDGLVFVVIFTDRGEVRRIISARVANRRERELWLT